MELKACPKCCSSKSLDEFYRRDNGRPSSWCRECLKARAAQNRAARTTPVYNPAVDIWSHRRRKYGLTREQFESMWKEQDGRCSICRRVPGGKGMCVDHDHKTNEVRGLLCNKCNWILGHAGDDPELLRDAAEYLLRYLTASRLPSARAQAPTPR